MKFIKKNYFWIIAAIMFLATAVRGGTSNNLSSLHLIPITEALSITRAQFSLGISAGFMVAMLVTMGSGVLISRFGYRTLMTVFLLAAGIGVAMMGGATQYWQFFVGYILLGSANGICGDALISRVVSTWFHKHRGTVLGVVCSSSGLGGSFMSLLQATLIEKISYHMSLYVAASMLIACAVLAFLLLRNQPSDVGIQPYGDGEQLLHQKREHGEDHWEGLSMQQILRRPTFYMMLLGTFLSCVLPYLAFYVIAPHMQDRGLTVTQAGMVQSVLLLCLGGSKILAGFLCDAIGVRKVVIICLGLDIVGMILLATVSSFTTAILAVVVYAMALPILTVVIPLLAISLFGYRAQTQYTGIFISMVSAASIVASPISNGIYDRIGTYSPVFFVAAALTALLIVMYLCMYSLANKDRKKIESQMQ